jgi:hypothetical protein
MPKFSPPPISVLVVLAVLLVAVLVARQMIIASRPPGRSPDHAVLRGVYTLTDHSMNSTASQAAKPLR